MSFILDAIAKSEQERQQQQTPDARSLAFPAGAPARSRRTAPYVFAGVLLLGIAILAAVWVQSPRPPVTPFVGSGGSVMPTIPEAASQPLAPVESRDPPPPAPADPPRPVSTAPLLADSSLTETNPRVQTPAVAETADAPTTGSSAGSMPGSGALAAENEIAAGDSRQTSLATDAGAKESGAPAAAAETPRQTETPRRRVSRLSELPADVRRVMPSVVFTGHLYSRNPRASYVFIDGGRQVVAGQQITDGLLLDEITPTGVVVEFQGYLIEVGVLQNWSLK